MGYQNLFETFFNNIGCAAIIIEEDTTILLSNKNFAELSGYPNSEIDGKKGLAEFFLPNDLKKIVRYHEQRRLNPDTIPRVYESKAIDRYGNKKDIIITVDMIPNTKKSIVSILDISEQKRATSSLKKSEDNFRTLADSITDIFFAFDNKLKYTYWNKASEDFTGIKAKDAIGRTFNELFPELKNTEVEGFYKDILRTKKPVNIGTCSHRTIMSITLISTHTRQKMVCLYSQEMSQVKSSLKSNCMKAKGVIRNYSIIH